MKRTLLLFTLLSFLLSKSFAQPFKFAFVTDTHIGGETADEDLQRTITDINLQIDLDFVILTGDVTEMGTDEEIKLAKAILNKLDIPPYILSGNLLIPESH